MTFTAGRPACIFSHLAALAPRWTMALALAATTAVATAQTLTTLTGGGNAAPTGVSNAQDGAYYISAANGRWTFYHGGFTFLSITSSGGGRISADGAYQTIGINNNGLITGESAPVISPAWSIPSSTTTTALPASDSIAARFTAATSTSAGIPGIPNNAYGHTEPAGGPADFQCYGSGDSGSVHSPTCMSQNGRFVGLQGYISTYNSAGTAILATNSFRFRPALWDSATNTTRLLPTPYRTSSSTTRRRDGSTYAISDDGQVIVGAQEPNVPCSANSPDPDGARLIVWRWNGSDYSISYLPNGVNASGFPIGPSISFANPGTVSPVQINPAGTIIVGPATSNSGQSYIGKWVWNGSSWNSPINLGSNVNPTVPIASIAGEATVTITTATPHGLSVNDWVYIAGTSVASYNGLWQVAGSEDPSSFSISAAAGGDATGGTVNKAASWLPTYILSSPGCTGNFPAIRATGMSADGSVVVGLATYAPNNCDTLHANAQAGWIWTAATGYMEDWYDHLRAIGVAGLNIGEPFGPPASNTPPHLAGPRAMSPDGSAFIGSYTLEVGAQPWILAPAHICGSADFNCDGDVGTDADIESFFACIAGTCPAPPCLSSADFNGDGDVGTDSDIEAFFRVLAGGAC
jgi:hypothetical protein